MEWEINPYVSFGPIFFGMSAAQVSTIIGPPTSRRNLAGGRVREGRTIANPRIVYELDRVVEIELRSDAGSPKYKQINIFTDNPNDLLLLLSNDDRNIYTGPGVLVFFDLGIATGVFERKREDILSLSAFAKGYWDDSMGILKPYKFLAP